MDGKVDIITVLAVIVLLVAVFQLRRVLGRRTPDDEARIDRKTRDGQNSPGAEVDGQRSRADTQGKVVTLPQRPQSASDVQPVAQSTAMTAELEARYKTAANGNVAIQNGLLAMLREDPVFDPDSFMSGAKQAYEMIVTAFAEGNRKVLKELLSAEVYDRFAGAISERESRSEMMDQSFVGINKAEMVEADLRNGTAEITVKFMSQLISAVRDKGGAVLSGDPQKIAEVTDVWTFAREVKARTPNWRLVATQAVE
jgi:predicted lipid-binding transport protein (Tim44 family)